MQPYARKGHRAAEAHTHGSISDPSTHLLNRPPAAAAAAARALICAPVAATQSAVPAVAGEIGGGVRERALTGLGESPYWSWGEPVLVRGRGPAGSRGEALLVPGKSPDWSGREPILAFRRHSGPCQAQLKAPIFINPIAMCKTLATAANPGRAR
eukprot:263164-Chlamydomonas_euryale.AAC.3